MSRKHKKNRKASTASTAAAQPTVATPPQAPTAPTQPAVVAPSGVPSLLDVLQEQTRACIEAKDWVKLREFAHQPLDHYSPQEQASARRQVLYMKMLACKQDQSEDHFSASDDSARLRPLLDEFIALTPGPLHHAKSVFYIYLSTVGYSVSQQVEAVKRLALACLDVVDLYWLHELRRHALALTPERLDFRELTADEEKLVQDLPDLHLLLGQAYAFAESSANLLDEERLLLQVLKVELDTLMAEAWDYEDVAARILQLPSPTAQGLAELATSGARQMPHPFTPRAWAILWTLHHAPATGLARALSTFSEPDACAGPEGLRLLAQSTLLPQESPQVDALITQATTLLAHAVETFTPVWRDWIAVQGPNGPVELYVGQKSLVAPNFADVLLKLYESLPTGYPRAAELRALYRIIEAEENAAELEEDEPDNSDAMPGLQWLCDQSPRFALAASSVIYGGAARLRLLLRTLEKWGAVEGAFPAARTYFYAFDEEVDQAEAQAIVAALERIGVKRATLTNDAVQVLHARLDSMLAYLSEVPSLAKRLLTACKPFVDDLTLTDHGLGWLACLSFKAEGDVVGATAAALTYWSDCEFPEAKVLEAAESSLARVKDGQTLRKLNELLQPKATLAPAAQLLAVVTKRLAAVDKQDQYLRTGVDRWPSLKPLTRKLLVVLSKVSRFDSMAELGQYAGIDANWVKWHYDKLVDAGMLTVEPSGITINPYVKPLLERESQHAVVGRIVRANGTIAVKQVFNSEREFGIYMVMVQLCPNHLVLPNCSLQSIISYERIKELVDGEDFSYYLKASVDLVVASTTTYLPMLAVEVDSVWHDTSKQTVRDERKDRIFAAAGIPLLRLRPVGDPSPAVIRGEVASHFQELVTSLRQDLPGFEQARSLLEELGKQTQAAPGVL